MKLTPVIAQDARTGAVLMLAYADAEALRRSRRTGFMHYWSRSRGEYWKKGGTSGHTQRLVRLYRDCDRDAILALVEQEGPACHLGTETCFGEGFGDAMRLLEIVVAERRKRPKKGSYTNRLLNDPVLLRDKVIEEATELLMAARSGKKKEVVAEAADVLYHLLALLASRGVSIREVDAELKRRRAARYTSRG